MRLIARLDVKPPNVVKPVHFEGLRKIGNPTEMASRYFKAGADEILYEDIVASLYRREPDFELIREVAAAVRVPFAVSGGLTNLTQIEHAFKIGADKVVLNTFPLQHDSGLIREASEIFGSQAVGIHIQAKKTNGDWVCCTDGGRIPSQYHVADWIRRAEDLGAGEIFVTSVDEDGRRGGFDVALGELAMTTATKPVVLGSGAGSIDHIKTLITSTSRPPSGLMLGSLLHYNLATIEEIRNVIPQD